MARRVLQRTRETVRVTIPAELGEAAVWRHIETRDLWKENPRRNDQAAEGVADLIILYGFGSPMMSWLDPDTGRDRIIAGNTRKKGVLVVMRRYAELVEQGGEANPEFERQHWHPQAKAIGKTGYVPVRERNDLSREEATELALADNRSSEWSTWDNGLLAGLMKNVDPDRALKLGWDADDLKRLLRPPQVVTEVEPQIEKADALQQVWKVKFGQIWKCGVHLVMCGDSSDKEHIKRLLKDVVVTLVFTDPPYGVNVAERNRQLNQLTNSAKRSTSKITDDNLDVGALRARLQPTFANVRSVLADDGSVYITAPIAGEIGLMVLQLLADVGLPARHSLIWKKNAPMFSLGRLDYDYQHEPILFTWGVRHKSIKQGPHKTSVWEIDRPRSSPDHPTAKPPELYENALLNSSEEGDVGFDPYGGSGPMVIACEKTKRVARVMEIKPEFVSVILQRWLDATGDRPVLVR